MEEHYICTGGCKGVSLTPGTCQTESCPKHGEPLESCNCQSDEHEEKAKDDEHNEK